MELHVACSHKTLWPRLWILNKGQWERLWEANLCCSLQHSDPDPLRKLIYLNGAVLERSRYKKLCFAILWVNFLCLRSSTLTSIYQEKRILLQPLHQYYLVWPLLFEGLAVEIHSRHKMPEGSFSHAGLCSDLCCCGDCSLLQPQIQRQIVRSWLWSKRQELVSALKGVTQIDQGISTNSYVL